MTCYACKGNGAVILPGRIGPRGLPVLDACPACAAKAEAEYRAYLASKERAA